MSRFAPCNFHQRPGGCRKGKGCAFLHTGPSGGSPGSPAHQAPASTSGPTTRSHLTIPAIPRAPNGVCNEFWATGQCKRSFECRFRHEQEKTPWTKGSRAPPGLPNSSETRNLDAAQVHNHLGKFIGDNYRFASPYDMHSPASWGMPQRKTTGCVYIPTMYPPQLELIACWVEY
jgi:hypothetical protein